ncbi:MAG: hypothetical protein M3211_12265, partial [Actinomycetota bacterium]|nr:hypothetical protein [Actinomycetota bacterium]
MNPNSPEDRPDDRYGQQQQQQPPPYPPYGYGHPGYGHYLPPHGPTPPRPSHASGPLMTPG